MIPLPFCCYHNRSIWFFLLLFTPAVFFFLLHFFCHLPLKARLCDRLQFFFCSSLSFSPSLSLWASINQCRDDGIPLSRKQFISCSCCCFFFSLPSMCLHFFFRSFPIHLTVCVCTFVWQKQFWPNWINNSFIIKAMSCVRVWSLTVDKQTIFIHFLLSFTFIMLVSAAFGLENIKTKKKIKPFALVMWLKWRDFVQRFLHTMCHPFAQDNTHKSQSN